MPIPQIKMIFCECCGKLLKVEKFGDVMTPEDMLRLQKLNKKKVCWKCRLLRKNDD